MRKSAGFLCFIILTAACTERTLQAGQSALPVPSSTRLPAVGVYGSATSDTGTSVFPPLFPPHTPDATYPPVRQWVDVLQYTPYPYSTPLPPAEHTQIDGVYAKYDPGEPEWWNCRRCPEYLPEVTGFSSVASYVIKSDRFYLFNDPPCPYDIGEYTWELEAGSLKFQEVKDTCAIHMRATNLTRQAWLSCQPPNTEAAISDHWMKPPGCE
jgi:hypothetical protein